MFETSANVRKIKRIETFFFGQKLFCSRIKWAYLASFFFLFKKKTGGIISKKKFVSSECQKMWEWRNKVSNQISLVSFKWQSPFSNVLFHTKRPFSFKTSFLKCYLTIFLKHSFFVIVYKSFFLKCPFSNVLSQMSFLKCPFSNVLSQMSFLKCPFSNVLSQKVFLIFLEYYF